MKVLNFIPNEVHNNLANRNKVCTIRPGDKSSQYTEGEVVWITYGPDFSQKKKLYTAMIDRILVKPMNKLTEREQKGENSTIKSRKDLYTSLNTMYHKNFLDTDLVTVLYFSEIVSE